MEYTLVLAYAVAYVRICDGAKPPEPLEREPGEFSHGWQYHEAVALDIPFVSAALVSGLPPARAAIRLSSKGPCGGRRLTSLPLSKDTTFISE